MPKLFYAIGAEIGNLADQRPYLLTLNGGKQCDNMAAFSNTAGTAEVRIKDELCASPRQIAVLEKTGDVFLISWDAGFTKPTKGEKIGKVSREATAQGGILVAKDPAGKRLGHALQPGGLAGATAIVALFHFAYLS